MTTGIYRITNTTTGRFYIGSAVNFARRKALHLCQLRAGKHGNGRMQRSWAKHGEAAFRFDLLMVCAPEHLLFYEQRLIDGMDACQVGYNILPVAGSALGFKHSPEHRALLAGNRYAAGLKHTDEAKRRMAEASRGNTHGAGHKRSEEHCEAIRAAHTGRKQTPEQIAKRVASTQATKAARKAVP